jgi:hypothetical protein
MAIIDGMLIDLCRQWKQLLAGQDRIKLDRYELVELMRTKFSDKNAFLGERLKIQEHLAQIYLNAEDLAIYTAKRRRRWKCSNDNVDVDNGKMTKLRATVQRRIHSVRRRIHRIYNRIMHQCYPESKRVAASPHTRKQIF